MITNDPRSWPAGDKIWEVCRAIALAEGANIGGSAPDRLNNPGDLSRGDEQHQAVIGYETLPDGEVAIHFASKEAGWNALYSKISNIAAGRSSVYSPEMTWRQISAKYAGNSSAWVNNVTAALGVNPDSRFGDFFFEPQTVSSSGKVIDPGPGEILQPVDAIAAAAPSAPVAEGSIPTPVLVGMLVLAGAFVINEFLWD